MNKSYWYYRATFKRGCGHPFGGSSEWVTNGVLDSENIFFPLTKIEEEIGSLKPDVSNVVITFAVQISETEYKERVNL